MDLDAFTQSLGQQHPPNDLPPLLKALWAAGKRDWNTAHEIAQTDESTAGSWVHAYLHRLEGDLSNAHYWYRKANKPMPSYSPVEEWQQIARHLLADLG